MPIIRSWALTMGFALHPGTSNRYEIRYTRTQHRPASRQVNDHGRVSGTHTLVFPRRNDSESTNSDKKSKMWNRRCRTLRHESVDFNAITYQIHVLITALVAYHNRTGADMTQSFGQHQLPTKVALRVSGRSEGFEQCPVGFAGIQQGADSVVVEVGEPEGGAFDPFHQIVGGLSGGVGDSGGVPVGDLLPPAPQGAPEPVDLFGHAGFLEVGGELGDGGGAGLGAGDVIDGSEGLFGVPGVADLAVGVSGVEQAAQAGVSVVGDALRRNTIVTTDLVFYLTIRASRTHSKPTNDTSNRYRMRHMGSRMQVQHAWSTYTTTFWAPTRSPSGFWDCKDSRGVAGKFGDLRQKRSGVRSPAALALSGCL